MKKSLFDSVQVGNCSLSNRLVRSATWEGLCDNDGAVTPKLLDFYRQLAQGGIGLIISGYSYVRADGKQLAGKMGIDHDGLLPGLKQLTQTVHDAGGKIFCQLVHAGGQTTSKVIGKTPLSPSVCDYAGYTEPTQEMSVAEIEAIVSAFGEAAARAKASGFDGVQLHGAHVYLINQFLSPITNQRQDEYGGTLENRMRFLEQVCQAVRAEVGPDYPVTIKLTACDHLEGGFTLEEAVIVSKRLQGLGIDAIEASSGGPASGEFGPARPKIDAPEKEAYNALAAAKIKAAVDIPVMTVGGLRSGAVMQKVLDDGSADMLSMSRPLIRQPNLPKLLNEDSNAVATCTSCNGCFVPGMRGKGIFCVLDKA
ncbi:MAG: NADH:flavin oxidoreductase [Desulfuromonadales bacterium]|nr:NADH:flavin oxidoreductase [Desulfuromonadales bacterium]